MKLKTLLLGAAASLALAGSAHAAGLYVGLDAGGNWLQDTEFDFASTPPTITDFDNAAESDNGWAVLATVGFGFAPQWRSEVELGYRAQDIDLFSSAAAINLFESGDLSQLTIMANVHYDIPVGSNFKLSLGGGLGVDIVNVDDTVIDETDSVFAYQGIAGAAYAIGPKTDLTLTYRYLAAEGPTITGVYAEEFDNLDNHTVTLGLRFGL